MTKRHFKKLAAILAHARNDVRLGVSAQGIVECIEDRLIDLCSAENPNFN